MLQVDENKNPYRRQFLNMGMDNQRPVGIDEPPLTMIDIDLLVRRRLSEQRFKLEREHADKLQRAQAQAWDEGRRQGQSESNDDAHRYLTSGLLWLASLQAARAKLRPGRSVSTGTLEEVDDCLRHVEDFIKKAKAI